MSAEETKMENNYGKQCQTITVLDNWKTRYYASIFDRMYSCIEFCFSHFFLKYIWPAVLINESQEML